MDDTRAIGATPVLVTPLTRRQWDKEDSHKIKSTLEPYAEDAFARSPPKSMCRWWIWHARSVELCEQFGPRQMEEFSPGLLVDGTKSSMMAPT